MDNKKIVIGDINKNTLLRLEKNFKKIDKNATYYTMISGEKTINDFLKEVKELKIFLSYFNENNLEAFIEVPKKIADIYKNLTYIIYNYNL